MSEWDVCSNDLECWSEAVTLSFRKAIKSIKTVEQQNKTILNQTLLSVKLRKQKTKAGTRFLKVKKL